MARPRNTIEMFWSRVDKADGPNACWLYGGPGFYKGYGVFPFDNKIYHAHRLSYILTHGDIAKDLVVRHSCDNPPCVNPAHLSLGTRADNSADMVKRGRSSFGERRPLAKLTEDQVCAIRKLKAEGKNSFEIAPAFGIAPGTVRNVANRHSWKHVS